MNVIHLASCESTQLEVRARLNDGAPGASSAVCALSQTTGRGRGGRTWQNPPGAALLISIGRREPLPASMLQELPRRVAMVVLRVLLDALGDVASQISWKAPNDLVSDNGAKIGGILVDARTVGSCVEEVIVGLGLNLGGAPFHTYDGRSATTIEAVCGVLPAHAEILAEMVRGIGIELGVGDPA